MQKSQKQKNSKKVDYIKINFESDEVNKNYIQNEVFKIYIQKTMLNQTFWVNIPQSIEIFKEKVVFNIIDFSPNDQEVQQICVTENTNITFEQNQNIQKKVFEDNQFILDSQILNELKYIIELNLFSKENIIFPQKHIQITGNSKSGKSWICQQILQEYENKLKIYNFMNQNFTKMEFISDKEMNQKQPFIIIIDQLNEKIDFQQIQQLFQRQESYKCMTITVVNSQHKIEFLEQNQIFDKTFFTQYPNQFQRKKFLSFFLQKLESSQEQQTLEQQMEILLIQNNRFDTFAENLSLKSPGFSFKDLQTLIQEVQLQMFIQKSKVLTNNILQKAFENVIPQQIKEKPQNTSKTNFDQIGGYLDLKNKIKTLIQLPLIKPELFLRKGLRPSKGILMYGPPGCSKTMFAKALATESNLNFISVKGPEIFNKYVGDSEKNIRDIFRKARLCAPTIIFFDEIDAIARKRGQSEVSDRILTQLLTEIDGVDTVNNIIFNIQDKEKLIVVGATNRPEILDSAILRPGRFDQLLYVGLPDQLAKIQILQIETSKFQLHDDVDIKQLSQQLNNYTGAEIVQVCKEAAMESIYQGDYEREQVTNDDFQKAIKKVYPRINSLEVQKYLNFEKNIQK